MLASQEEEKHADNSRKITDITDYPHCYRLAPPPVQEALLAIENNHDDADIKAALACADTVKGEPHIALRWTVSAGRMDLFEILIAHPAYENHRFLQAALAADNHAILSLLAYYGHQAHVKDLLKRTPYLIRDFFEAGIRANQFMAIVESAKNGHKQTSAYLLGKIESQPLRLAAIQALQESGIERSLFNKIIVTSMEKLQKKACKKKYTPLQELRLHCCNRDRKESGQEFGCPSTLRCTIL